jgi:hypothetical protein
LTKLDNKLILSFKGKDEIEKTKLYEEIKSLNTKCDEISDKFALQKAENDDLKKRISYLNANISKR